MSAPATIVILFGLACPEPCPFDEGARARIEAEAVRAIADRGFEVRPAPEDALRPTGDAVDGAPRDEARRLGAGRVVAIDVEPEATRLWITHYVRGTMGPWSVRRHTCVKTATEICPGVADAVLFGLRPRRVDDVDFVGFLRRSAPKVGVCVRAEDRVPAALRLFGRVEIELEVTPDGGVRVVTIAPARAARGKLGQCLKRTLEAFDLGPFQGEAVRLRVPLDL